jgi:rfaE bifunctional protein nucleotidyltransferase chain/domain
VDLLLSCGVEIAALRRHGPTLEKTRVRASDQSLVRFDRGSRHDAVEPPTDEVLDVIGSADAVIVADYGAGVTANEAVRAALTDLAHAARRRPFLWDPHPDGAPPVPGAWLVTPNEREAIAGAPATHGPRITRVTEAARMLLRQWSAHAIAVTLGADGALLAGASGPPLLVPARPVKGDTCGAGDCLAAATAVALVGGALTSEAVEAGVAAATDFVANGGASSLSRRSARGEHGGGSARVMVDVRDGDLRGGDGDGGDDGAAIGLPAARRHVARARARDGIVVATGGCFDLLHAGHISVLEGARALGDCLVVCLNSDRSVRRLKGSSRPIQAAEDRAAVLASLKCVDAVVIFEEDTPQQVLATLRPDVFVKGGDYSLGSLPEEATLRAWGGQVVILPYLAGRSTTALLAQAGIG